MALVQYGDFDIATVLSHGQLYQIQVRAAKLSKTLCSVIEDGRGGTITLSDVEMAPVFPKIVEYLQYHADNPSPPIEKKDEHRTDNLVEWDVAFFNVELQTLYDIINAAHYLEATELLYNGCKTFVNIIKGKTTDEICDRLGWPRMTKEELEQAKKDFPFCCVDCED